MFVDFRKIYGVSAELIGTTLLTWNEAYHLILGLLQDTNSALFSEIHEIKALSKEAYYLIAVHNAIITSIPVDKKDKAVKEKAKMKFPESKKKKERKQITKPQAEKRFAHVKIAVE